MKLTDIFNAASIAFNWNTYVADSNEPPYIGEGFFPAKKKAGLDLKFSCCLGQRIDGKSLVAMAEVYSGI